MYTTTLSSIFSYGSQWPRGKLRNDLSQPLARFTATHMYVSDSRWVMYKSFSSILTLCMKGLKLTRSSEVQKYLLVPNTKIEHFLIAFERSM